MAVTIGIDEVKRAIRVGDGADETAEVGRLLALATIIVQDYAPHAPGALQDEAAIRLIGYLYDQPTLSRQGQYSAAVRNCGMAALLSQYRAIRAGGVGAAPGAGVGGVILPPGSDRGNVSAFSFRSAGKLAEFTNSTGGQFIPVEVAAGESVDRVLLDEEIPGPIFPDTDFFMQFVGFVQVQPTDSRHDFIFELTVRHVFGASFDKVIEISRTVGQRVARDQEYSLPLNVFDSVSVVRIGAYETQDDRTVEITQDDLALPSRITITLKLREQSPGTAFDLEIYQSALISYRAFQLRQAVATGIDVDLADFRADLADLRAKDAAIDVDINTIETQLQSAFRRLVPLPGNANKGDVLTLDPTLPGVNFGWEPPAESGNLPDAPDGASKAEKYDLQVDTDGTVTWELQPDYASQSALDATNAAVNALDGDVRANTTAIAGKAAQAALTALNQEVNRFGTQAEANRVALANLKLPNAPDAGSAAALYELQVAADGTVTWEVASSGPGDGLLGAETTRLGAVRFARADTLNQDSATKQFSDADSDAIRKFLAKTDPKDLVVTFLITFDGDGGSVIQTQEFTATPIHLPAAHVPAALKHFHFNQTYAQVTGDPAATSRGELSLTVPEAGKKVSAVLDVSATLKAANALRNTTTVDVFVYGREFQAVQESKVPDPPAAGDADTSYELQVDTDGAATWVEPEAPSGGGGPTIKKLMTFTITSTMAQDGTHSHSPTISDTGEIDALKTFMNTAGQKWIYFRMKPAGEFVNDTGYLNLSSPWIDLGNNALDVANINGFNDWRVDCFMGDQANIEFRYVLGRFSFSGQDFDIPDVFFRDGYDVELMGVTM